MREYPTDEELSAFVARLEQEELYAPAHLKEEILLKTEQTKKSQTAPVSFFVYTLKMVAGMAAAIILTFVIPASDGSEFSKAKDLENYPSEAQNDISMDEKISRYMEERRKEKYEETDSLFEKMNELFSRNSGGNDDEN